MEQIALLTGAAGGVGRALAARLTANGARLIVVSRDAARLREAYGDAHLQIEADCGTPAGVRHIFDTARAAGMLPNALAHCVGNIRLGAMHRMSEADLEDCLRANLFSAFHTLAGFAGAVREAGGGAAVFVSSAAARIGTPNHEAIAAAKAGVEGMVRGAAATYAAAGLRVNAVAPGIMETPASASLLGSQVARDAAAKQYPLPGIGSADELAGLMAWLLSPAAARVTGQVWSLDAGFTSVRPLVR